MTKKIDNSMDIIDSRDIVDRIEYLETIESVYNELSDKERDEFGEKYEDELAELGFLRRLAEQCEGYSRDWPYGIMLIRDSYWIEYVEELLKEIGDLPQDFPWYIEIDWETTANNIKADYTGIDFDGMEYLIRN